MIPARNDGQTVNHAAIEQNPSEPLRTAWSNQWLERMRDQRITLAHGSGGKAMRELIEHLFVEAFNNPLLAALEDQAVVPLDDLRRVRAAVQLPVLRKDFILDRYQVLEARAAGADCVLLIAECLDDATLRDLHEYAGELGMQTLVELYEPENLERVLALSPSLIGVNNRNLKTMVTDLDHSLRLVPRVPPSVLFVSESGIRNHADVVRLQHAGVRAILVGESLMRAPDVGAAVDALMRGSGDDLRDKR